MAVDNASQIDAIANDKENSLFGTPYYRPFELGQ